MYINTTKGGVIAVIIFSIMSIFFSGRGPITEITIIITISTFVFSILAGFFLSRLTNRYYDIRDLIAKEDGLLLSLYKTSCLYGPKFSNKIRKLIDRFYITIFDISAGGISPVYKSTTKYFLELFNELKSVMNKKNTAPLKWMLTTITNFEEVRNQLSVKIQERITISKWVVLDGLAFIIIFSVFYIQGDLLYSKIITVFLSSSLVIILLIIRDYDNLEIPVKIPLFESGQENLEAMGLKRYYPTKLKSMVPKNIKEYRLGYHKVGEKIKIKHIRL